MSGTRIHNGRGLTLNIIFKTLLRTSAIGLLSGPIFGFGLGISIYQDAKESVRHLPAMEAGSVLCAAGQAPFALGILGIPAGALFGLILGGLFLLYRSIAGGPRLP